MNVKKEVLLHLMTLISAVLGQVISPNGILAVIEGDLVQFNCTTEDPGSLVVAQLNRNTISDLNLISSSAIPNGYRYSFGPVTEEHNQGTLRCAFIPEMGATVYTDEITLDVKFPPSITPPIINKSAIEGTSFTTPLIQLLQ